MANAQAMVVILLVFIWLMFRPTWTEFILILAIIELLRWELDPASPSSDCAPRQRSLER